MDEIIKEIEITRNIILAQLEKGFNQNDVRVAFFEILYDTYKNLYRVLVYSESKQFEIDSLNLNTGLNRDIERFNWKSYFHYCFIIKCWSNFESCINQICKEKEVLNIDIFVKLKETEYLRIIEELRTLEIPEDVNNNLYIRFYRENIEQVSINLKTDQIYKTLKNKFIDTAQIKSDKKYLEFYGRLRNSIHSNYVYYGNNFDFNFKGMKFQFENGKPFKQDPISDLTFFHLSIELRNIYHRIIDHISCNNLIPDENFPQQ